MRLLVWEYVTGGGVQGSATLSALAAEGLMMLDRLVRDCASIPGVEVTTVLDERIEHPLPPGVHVRRLAPSEDPWPVLRDLMGAAGAVWPVAPETDGILERVTAEAEGSCPVVLGSRRDALAVARSKLATARHLAAAGIPVIPAQTLDQALPASATGWVMKPDDGAGCEETRVLASPEAVAAEAARRRGSGFMVQPFVPGDALSLSVLMQEGDAWVLACNRQHVAVEDGGFVYRGSVVGGAEDRRARLVPLAREIAASLPGLWGHVGIDVVDGPSGPLVVEINPRLTTSYAGLADSIGCNPAAFVLALAERRLAEIVRPLAPRPVEVLLP